MNSRASSSDDARTEWLSLEDVYSASVGTRTSDSVAPTIHHCCPTCNGPVACNRTETVSNDSVEGGARERLVQIRSRPSGRYGMFRDLWALRLAAFGSIDRNGGLPFSTATPPGGPDALPMTRTMNDSLIQVVLPFRENKELFGDYVNIYGGIRFGKIMEDLDVFAATCAYMHCGTSTAQGEKLTIVTAAVDRIDMHMRLDEPVNLRMKGMVTFVGKSSMEVTILVESSMEPHVTENGRALVQEDVVIDQIARDRESDDQQWKRAALAKFIMVARGAAGPVHVPRLTPNTPQERAIFQAGEERHAARMARDRQSLFKEPPTAAESILLHQLFLSPMSSGPLMARPRVVLMSDTLLKTTKICHPQERNIHDLIFGGYLMREAFELGYTCGQLFSHAELQFLAVDELAFKHPVPIGALLQLTAQVVYTQEDATQGSQLIHVEVVADVVSVQTGERKTTNTFHFTYRLEAPPLHVVRPATYVEAMRYLEGKRRISAAPLDPHRTIYRF